MNPEVNRIIGKIEAETQRLKNEASDIIDAINYLKEASEGHEKGVNLLGSYIDDLTKALSINTNPINTGSSSGPFREDKPISDPIPNKTISIEVESPKSDLSSKKFIQINHPYTEEEEKPLNPKEEEYKQFSTWVYSTCSHNSTIFKAPGKNKYPRMIVTKGAHPLLVGKIAKYGYLDLVYPDIDLREIASLDDLLVKEVSRFAQKRPIYLKFYTISPEYYQNIEYQAFYMISVGHLTKNFKVEVGTEYTNVPQINEPWIRTRRARGIKAIWSIAKDLYKRNFRTIIKFQNYILITSEASQGPSNLLLEFINEISTMRFPSSSKTMKQAYQFMEVANNINRMTDKIK